MSATAGYSGTPLPKKLGIKEGFAVTVIAGPPEFQSIVGDLPPGAELNREAIDAEIVILFALTVAELEDRFETAMTLIPADGSIWVAWPKKTSGVVTELSFDVVQPFGLSTGLVDNKVCAIDETWSGLRFVVRKENRSEWGTRTRD